MTTEAPKDWRDHVLLIAPAGAGAVLWARLQARSVPLRDWDLRQSDSEYLWRLARIDDRWAYSGTHVQQSFGLRASDSCRVPVPFRAPHHSVSVAGLVGRVVKGWRLQPGELSLAHGGVLLLDEANEFRLEALGNVFDAMRTGVVRHRLPGGEISLPAEFRLIATGRPCPCGFHGAAPALHRGAECRCSARAVERWQKSFEPLRERCRVIEASEWQLELEARKGELT